MSQLYSVTLTLGSTGTEIDVWDEWEFTIDMLHPGQAWTFTFWHSASRQSTWRTLLSTIKILDSMRLSIDGAVQLSGVIVHRELVGDTEGGMRMIVSGKSMAAQAAKWDVQPTIALHGIQLQDALTAILFPLNETITIGVDADGTRQVQQGRRRSPWNVPKHRRTNHVDTFKPKPGEKMWACADRLARRYGYMLWEAPDANNGLSVIVDAPITTIPAGVTPYQFERIAGPDGITTQGSNIEHGSHRLSVEDVPTEVHMMATSGRGDGQSSRFLQDTINTLVVNDPRVYNPVTAQPIYRVTEHSRDQDGASQEAQRLLAVANASYESYTATVQGASQMLNGQSTIYAVNSPAHVRDDFYQLEGDFIITSFTCRGSAVRGVSSTLKMSPLGSIVVVPEVGT